MPALETTSDDNNAPRRDHPLFIYYRPMRLQARSTSRLRLAPFAAIVTASIFLASCHAPSTCDYTPQLTGPAWIRTELYFGLDIPPCPEFPAGGRVSEELWQTFVDEEITPRFPDGLSILHARGQWRDGGPDSASSRIVREDSRIVLIFRQGNPINHSHDTTTSAASSSSATPTQDQCIEAIRAAYKQRFHQDAVMRVESIQTVRFD